MCKYDFERLNSQSDHYIMTGGPPQWIPEIFQNGNDWAWLQDKISDDFGTGSGAGYAEKAFARAKYFADVNGLPVPKWFFLNEISISRWVQNRPGYHQYIIDMATAIKSLGSIPVIFVPFMLPTRYKESWVALKDAGGYIAVEAYLNSRNITKSGPRSTKSKPSAKRLAYIKKLYGKSITAFGLMGIPKKRLMFFEHYGFTPVEKNYGRSGVSSADWADIIRLRGIALKSLKVYGTGGYGWIGNAMQLPNTERAKFYDAYLASTTSLP
jgi:hypothetical protein